MGRHSPGAGATGQFTALANSITVNAKGDNLISALTQGFERIEELSGQCKAVIFTESRRTQQYLLNLLSNHGYAGRNRIPQWRQQRRYIVADIYRLERAPSEGQAGLFHSFLDMVGICRTYSRNIWKNFGLKSGGPAA